MTEERLAIGRANQRAVMRRLDADQLVEVLSRGMDLPRRPGTVELRCVAADGRHLGFEGIGDVHDERRLHRILAVGEGVEDFERPVRGAPPAPPYLASPAR